jgi:hypothetical protein
MRRRRLGALVLLLALGLLAIAALRDFVRLGDALPWKQLYDFPDFYCAGAALDERADPYRYEPLHRCEHAVNESAAYRHDPRRVVPAPLPPYDFPPFMLAARLSFSLARTIDAVAILLAVAAAVWGLTLVAVPWEVAALSLLLPGGFLLLAAGQIVPFALLALVLCGVALARRQDSLAGVLAAATMIEPHLGLPVCLAALVWAPRSRGALIGAGIVLGCVAAITTGIGGVAEYLSRVVPAQAAAETGYVYQYSLTYVLKTLGAPAFAAIVVGELSYAAVLVLSIWLARRLELALGRRELLAYLPAALSLAGGPYVHMVDLAVAVPAALVLTTCLRGRAQNLAALSLVMLAIPWIAVWITKKLFLSTLWVVAALLLRLQIGAAESVITFASVGAAMYLLELAPPAPFVAITLTSFAAGDLAQDAWREYVAGLGAAGPLWFVVKLPTWIALGGLVAVSIGAARSRPAQR